MSDFRVVKQRVNVRMLVSGRERQGTLFLAPVSPLHEGGERVSDLLTLTDPFLPVELNGQTHCVATDAIAAVWARSAVAVREQELDIKQSRVRVELTTGTTFEGVLRYSLPEDQSRTVDFLNQAGMFFPLHLDKGDEVVLIHRRHVSWVEMDPPAKKSARAKSKPVRLVRPASKRKKTS